MKEGTISVLIGVHSPIHSILVSISWTILYRKLPKFWELCCIFLHDVGHFGKDYLSDKKQKDEHTILGAKIAKFLFGDKGYNLIIDHDYNKNNKLYKPDKYSWYITPKFIFYSNAVIEPKINGKLSIKESVNSWIAIVKKSIESGEFINSHDLFLNDKRRHPLSNPSCPLTNIRRIKMDLISCDQCGVALDRSKLMFPDGFDKDTGKVIDEEVIWDGIDYVPITECPLCGGKIQEYERDKKGERK